MTDPRPLNGAMLYREALGAEVLDFNQAAAGRAGVASLGTLSGFALQWDTWAGPIQESGSRFMETMAPGSFDRTIQDRGPRIRMLYAHGSGPIGDMPLGPLTLQSDKVGLRYSVQLLDTAFNRDLAPALRAGLMGASVRFAIVRDEFTSRPKRSEINPEGIPERRVLECRLFEISAVTFPAYSSSSATLRWTH